MSRFNRSNRRLNSVVFCLVLLLPCLVQAEYSARFIDSGVVGIFDSGRMVAKCIESRDCFDVFSLQDRLIGRMEKKEGRLYIYDRESNYVGIAGDVVMGFMLLNGPGRESDVSPIPGISVVMFSGHSLLTLEFSVDNGDYHRVTGDRYLHAFVIRSGERRIRLRYGGRAAFGMWDIEFDGGVFYTLTNTSEGQVYKEVSGHFRDVRDLGFNERVRVHDLR